MRSLSSSLIHAIAAGDESGVRALLSQGADVNAPSKGGQTPLIVAVVCGHTHLLHLLIKAGADPLVRDNTGLDAIDWAQRRGSTEAISIFGDKKPPPPGTTSQKDDSSVAPKNPARPATKTTASKEMTPQSSGGQAIPSDEKARKWIAGLRQRFEEKARREATDTKTQSGKQPRPDANPQTEDRVAGSEKAIPESTNKPEVFPKPSPDSTPERSLDSGLPTEPITPEAAHKESASSTEPAIAETSQDSKPPTATSSTRSTRKRCPQCNAVYDDELIAYCAHHIVRLVDADAPIEVPTPAEGMTPLLWVLVAITLAGSAYVGYLITGYLQKGDNVTPPIAAAPVQTSNVLKGIPVVGGDLVGANLSLPEAEYPVPTSSETPSGTVTVRVRVDYKGRVYWTRSSGGDQTLREAAVQAATKATFSPEKLGGRRAEGTITYTFQASTRKP